MLEKTCGNCPKIDVKNVAGMLVFGCKETGFVIPHESDRASEMVIFWRIPCECPRPEGEVIKSKNPVPKVDWIIKSFTDF